MTFGLLILLAYIVMGIPSTLYVRLRGLPDPSHLEHNDDCYGYDWVVSRPLPSERHKKRTVMLCKNDRRLGHCKLQLWEWVLITVMWPISVICITFEWLVLTMLFVLNSISPILLLAHKALTVRF